jgi:hypothetical protein
MHRIFIKIFPVYVGKCLSHKAVHYWVENVSLITKMMKRFSEFAETSQNTSMLRVSTHL